MRETQTLTPRTIRLLDIQGFDTVDLQELAPVAPWLRLAFGLCALLAGVGTILASPTILLVLMPIAALGAASPVHPTEKSVLVATVDVAAGDGYAAERSCRCSCPSF